MHQLKMFLGAAAALLIAGCTSYGALLVKPGAGQSTRYQDGNPTIESQLTNKVVVSPARTIFNDDDGLLFVSVLVDNDSAKSFAFSPQDISAWYVNQQGRRESLKVYSYREVVLNELDAAESSAIASAFYGLLSGLTVAIGGSSGSFGHAHYAGAAINIGAAAVAASQRAADSRVASQSRMADLGTTMLKRQTLATGQWYGGIVQLDGPDIKTAPHDIHMDVRAGEEVHHFVFTEKQIDN